MLFNDNRKTVNSVNNPQNTAISFGESSTNTVTNNYGSEIEDLTTKLLELLKMEIVDTEIQEELTELVEGVSDESTSEKPKKALMKNLLGASKSIMDTVNKSPQLIETYQKWATFIQSAM